MTRPWGNPPASQGEVVPVEYNHQIIVNQIINAEKVTENDDDDGLRVVVAVLYSEHIYSEALPLWAYYINQKFKGWQGPNRKSLIKILG